MPYQLSHGRSGSASVMVRNRFLVLLGGRDDTVYETPDVKALATLDIIDTVHSVVVTNAGPSMKVARRICGACLVNETTLWVVGGTDCYHGTDITLHSVESIDLHKNPRLLVVPNKQSPPRPRLGRDDTTTNMAATSSFFAPNSVWTLHPNLSLRVGREGHAVAAVGDGCILVVGGWDAYYNDLPSVELIQTRGMGQGVVRVAGLNMARWRPTLSVVTRTGKGANNDDSANSSNNNSNKELAMVVGGDGQDSIEVLEWSYSFFHQTHDTKRKTNNSTTGRVRKRPHHGKESPKSVR